jgi:hypothetical protein
MYVMLGPAMTLAMLRLNSMLNIDDGDTCCTYAVGYSADPLKFEKPPYTCSWPSTAVRLHVFELSHSSVSIT